MLVSDHTAYRLVDRPGRLLIVPVAPRNPLVRFAVEVIALEDYFSVEQLRERDAYNDYHSGCVVRKVKALRKPASADAHQDSAFQVIFINSAVVPIDDKLVLCCALGLSKNLFVFLNLPHAASLLPPIVNFVQ